MFLLNSIAGILLIFMLGSYLMLNLQWYSYKFLRVIFKHHRPLWHILYFVLPLAAFYILEDIFYLVFYFLILPFSAYWYYQIDKKLVFTWRIKRFFIFLLLAFIFENIVFYFIQHKLFSDILLPLFIAYILSIFAEKYLYKKYKQLAQKKLQSMKDLQIVCITGSYGKTSIKNFTASILENEYKTYATPRSINTLTGIIWDINNNLPEDTQIYVCEAGAREKGDIYDIAMFLKPQTAVVGKIGMAHIEYFKTLDNIISTKLELIQSPRLEQAFIHKSAGFDVGGNVVYFGNEIDNLNANLKGTSFDLNINDKTMKCHTSILGGFQATNISVAVYVAKVFRLSDKDIVNYVSKLKPVEHRLQIIEAGGKLIIDDGYNGNLEGILEGIRLCSLHTKGNKIIVTPGLIESTHNLNLKLIQAINEVFDIAIVTGRLNSDIFKNHLTVQSKIILEDKSSLTSILAGTTKSGDIILFANDAPNFI